MSANGVDLRKRRFLTLALTATSAVGAGFASVPFISAMSPSDRTKAMGAPVEIDISKLLPGQLVRVKWRGKPVWVVKRSPEMLERLNEVEEYLADPESDASVQPEDCKNSYRSLRPEIYLAVGICTHLGCSPSFRPDVQPDDLGNDWFGGFFCPCHGSKFDLAGRIYAGMPAPNNLEIPPHYYINDDRIMVGVGSKEETA
ncbi:MAG: ubiquinol-cytochrome c reductase iron-sulfur subunit [Gammaproteobacteria bacterium]|nr:ubiquinol-cytochrome c reductase iron-sulfur subunit [Gammaproteobacteria bacterium]